MQNQTVHITAQAIQHIENHLNHKLDLDSVAAALNYSKFHLHRIFKKTTGLTIHNYIQRRRLTEAAKLLVSSQKSIIDIALISGYESQQAFTGIFKAMYKTTPAHFRETNVFYPLQLEICLTTAPRKTSFLKEDIQFATPADIEDWMALVNLTIDGYPCLNKSEYRAQLHQCIANKNALILRDERTAIGILGFSADTGSIDFLAIHPQYRHFEIAQLFLDKLADDLLFGKEISLTTYRTGDKADTGYREEYRRLGFAERELLVEYGYPTQRFVLLPKNKEDTNHARNTKKNAGKSSGTIF